jgi:hypothetical protein
LEPASFFVQRALPTRIPSSLLLLNTMNIGIFLFEERCQFFFGLHQLLDGL